MAIHSACSTQRRQTLPIKDIARLGLMVAVLEVSKLALNSAPNIELISFWVILFTLHTGWRTLYAVYVFVLLEGILFGIHFWWISYLYVWAVLVLITQLFRNQEAPLFWSMLSAMFGLGFGALCAIPYGITGALNGGLWNGAIAAFSWWVAGIPYDLLHCAGNFVIMLVMYKPMHSAMQRIL